MADQGVVNDANLPTFLNEKFAKWWAMLRLGHNGMMLERTQRQLKAAENIADISMKGNTDGVNSLYPEDDMGVSIGNEVHNHYYMGADGATPTPVPAPIIAPTSTTTTTNTTERIVQDGKTIWPYVVGTAALVSSLFGGGGALYNYYHQASPPVVTAPNTDTDNITDVGIDE